MKSSPAVYGIMVTGKDEQRIAYARLIGLKNFEMQTYTNKHLIIVNHGTKPVLTHQVSNVYELMVDKTNFTLGDLRNLALQLVPLNAIWYVHDDDDFRSANYIEFMVSNLLKNKAIAVFLKNRMEYNLANGYTFKSGFAYGNTHIMCIKLERLQYMSKDTLEDTRLQTDIQSFKKKYVSIDNDPKMYVRVIHQNNTSPFAHDSRADIVKYNPSSYYQEYEATDDEKAYVKSIIAQHYKFFSYTK